MPFFILAALFFLFDGLRRDPARRYGPYVAGRFKRVYVPFLIWSALALVGVALVLRLDVFPWPLDRDTSIIYGAIFLGSAVYFTYGLTRPVWGNAKGQLLGFLAYDLVLIVPFVRLWFSVPSLSLAIYLAVIVTSALLAIWYLALSPRYRLWTSE